MNRPMQPTRPAPAPGQAAAEAAADAHYQGKRAEALILSAASLVIADVIARGLEPDTAELPTTRMTQAFTIAEAFIAEAEKRLGGKLPL
jgi:hypothetical protein